MIEDFIGIFPNVASKEYCEKVIRHFNQLQDSNKILTRQDIENASPNDKKNKVYFLESEQNESIQKINDVFIEEFKKIVWGCYEQYVKKYGVLYDMNRHSFSESFKIQRTDVSEGYHVWHCEQSSLRYSNRLMLSILYLNDVEEGGETEFLYQCKRVMSKQGTVMLCPASYTHTHRGNPPLKGSKYIMNTWIQFLE